MIDATLTAPTTSARREARAGWTMAALSTFCFSFAPPLSKAAIELGINPTALLAVRLLLTTGLLGGTILFTAPERLRIDRRGLLACGAAGLANGVGMLTFFWSLTRLHSSVASMIFSLSPLVLLGLLALRGEKFTYRNILRLALGLGGVYLLIGPGGEADWLGIVLAFGAVFTVPIQLLVMQWYLQDYDSRTVTLYTVGVMALVAAGWWLVEGPEWRDFGWRGWLLVIALVVVSTYLSRLMMFVAIQGIGSGQVGLLAPLETFLTVIWSLLFLGERLTLWQWAGGSLILVSALTPGSAQRLGRVLWRK
ncbi:MAG: DMT family transporter [Anaerolineales bacterium]